MSEPVRGHGTDDATRTGPGRVIVAVYAVFALSATARAGYQLLTRFEQAPLPYLLSALAAVVYVLATVGLARGGPGGRRLAAIACSVELVGVLAVGLLTVVDPGDFPADTVWSEFGRGYGYVPLVLPLVGLWWVRRHSRSVRRPRGA